MSNQDCQRKDNSLQTHSRLRFHFATQGGVLGFVSISTFTALPRLSDSSFVYQQDKRTAISLYFIHIPDFTIVVCLKQYR